MILATVLLDVTMISTSYVCLIFGDFLIASIFLSSSKKPDSNIEDIIADIEDIIEDIEDIISNKCSKIKSLMFDLC